MIPYGKQWIDDQDRQAVLAVLGSDWITQGPAITAFEDALAAACGAKYAVVFNSGTSALHGAYEALRLSHGDRFITSPNTFAATANAGRYLGLTPIFSDIEKDTGNLSVDSISPKLAEEARLVVPVHYAGHPVDMASLQTLARDMGLFIVEDACHALGARHENSSVGSCRYSDMTVMSFHPVKIITTGEGGAVLTNNPDFYERLSAFRSHGITRTGFLNEPDGDWYYEMQSLGYNYRMTDIQAALGRSQLGRLETFINRRRDIASKYQAQFQGNPYFDIPVEREYAESAYHLYPIRLREALLPHKKRIFSRLREVGLGVQVHYLPVYLHPYYQKLGYQKGLCPEAESFYEREISIPIYPLMSDSDLDYVVGNLFAVLEEQ